MSILTELQNKRLGLLELISMGFDVYFKNLKSILLVFCTIYLPFLIVISALSTHMEQNSTDVSEPFLVLFFVLLVFNIFAASIYFIAVAVITDNYVQGITTNYQRVVNKVFSSLVTLVLLSFRFGIIYCLRCLLLVIPGIIYLINNQYYGLAFILRDQRGTDAFHYSQSLVKGNWWKVFFFAILGGVISLTLQIGLSRLLSLVMTGFWAELLSQLLPQFIAIGVGVAGILLFLNLDFQKSLDS